MYNRCYKNVVVRLLFSLPFQIEYVKQGVDQTLQDGQEKLHQMWLDWSKRQAGESEDKDLIQPEVSNQDLALVYGISAYFKSAFYFTNNLFLFSN